MSIPTICHPPGATRTEQRLRRQKRQAILAVAAAISTIAPAAKAANFTTLYSFGGARTDGVTPCGTLVLSGSVLYGMTCWGGGMGDPTDNGWGTIFQYDTSSHTEAVLHAFNNTDYEACVPTGSLLKSGSILYGMSSDDDALGSFFKYDTSTNTYTYLHRFVNETEGQTPDGALIQDYRPGYNSTFYGTTGDALGPSPFGSVNDGNIFQFNPSAPNPVTNLYYFSYGGGPPTTDGSLIQDSRSQHSSMLYGIGGGGNYNAGAIFQYDTSTSETPFVLKYSFAGGPNDGSTPCGSLIQAGSMVYGMTSTGGAHGVGTIFEYNLDTGAESILHSFDWTHGRVPVDSLVLVLSPDGRPTLYGMTSSGGVHNDGTVFQYDLSSNDPATAYKVLYSFTGGSDGGYPGGSLTLSADGSTLYGVTGDGGAYGDGTIFALSLVPEPGTLSLLVLAGGTFLLRRRRPVTAAQETASP